MSAWKKEELQKIAAADDLHIAPFRDDGATSARRRGYGLLRSATPFTCAATTERNPIGISPRCGKRPAVSSRPA